MGFFVSLYNKKTIMLELSKPKWHTLNKNEWIKDWNKLNLGNSLFNELNKSINLFKKIK